MGRQNVSASDGLELLLDTICNTFGGVLFIAILVVILLNVTSEEVAVEPASPAQQQRLARLHEQLKISQSELERLEQAAARQEVLQNDIEDTNVQALLDEVKATEARIAQATSEKMKLLNSSATETRALNERANRYHSAIKALQSAQQKLADLQARLANETAKRTTSKSLPKIKMSGKLDAGFILKGGRLYNCKLPNGAIDLQECEIEKNGARKYVVPKANKGLAINLAGVDRDAIRQKLSPFPPDKYYLVIAVFEDSFEHFRMLREVLQSNKFEILLMPLPNNDKVLLKEGGKRSQAPVQEA